VNLDKYLAVYNRERAHQAYRTEGRAPYQAFLNGIAQLKEAETPEVA